MINGSLWCICKAWANNPWFSGKAVHKFQRYKCEYPNHEISCGFTEKNHVVLPNMFTTMKMRHLGEVQPQNTRGSSTRYREVLCKHMPKTMDGFTCQDWRRFVLFLLLLLLGVNQVKFGGNHAQQTHHKDEHRTRASQHNSNKLPANNLQPAHVKYLILS